MKIWETFVEELWNWLPFHTTNSCNNIKRCDFFARSFNNGWLVPLFQSVSLPDLNHWPKDQKIKASVFSFAVYLCLLQSKLVDSSIERACVCVWHRETERVCVWERESVCVWERESVCVVCVRACVRAYVRACMRWCASVWMCFSPFILLSTRSSTPWHASWCAPCQIPAASSQPRHRFRARRW